MGHYFDSTHKTSASCWSLSPWLTLQTYCFLLGFLSSPLAVHLKQSAPWHSPARHRKSVPPVSSNHIIPQFCGKKLESGISMGLMWACFTVWYPNGLIFFSQFWYPYGSKFLAWVCNNKLVIFQSWFQMNNKFHIYETRQTVLYSLF